ncbi:MAG: TIGR03986 family CRISPR-associated RAMP protein [Candidatus Heimdallarchaeota archaeon]|nr:TIGR03986 family CRISPR-associated RAMP protein [Candidatus Heimdallarchaeota archaeon]
MSPENFMNPYNFVRFLEPSIEIDEISDKILLRKCRPPPHDRYISLTGKIECRLKTTSPLFITDSEQINKLNKGYNSYEFFKLLGKNGKLDYAIPSTSLRGMLRSVFEAATNSCFSILEGGLLGKRRRPEYYKWELHAGLIKKIPDKDNPGIVEKLEAYLLPHRKFPQYKNKVNQNGKKIFIQIDDEKVIDVKEITDEAQNNNENYEVGYLKTSDRGIGRDNKHYERVFKRRDDYNEEDDYQLDYQTYKNYIVANRNNKHQNTREPKRGDTIWFRTEEESRRIKEFSYAQIYRAPFPNSIEELLPEYFHPCDNYNTLCPGCRVFGWTHPDPPEDNRVKVAYKGRIMISHGKILNSPKILEVCPINLNILSTPKPTTAYFYLLKKSNKQPDFKIEYEEDKAILRGRKFYYHNRTQNLKNKEYVRPSGKKDKQSRELRDVLTAGNDFSFFIEFKNLAPLELGALLWTIKLEENMNHRLGLAKPYGFGSNKISIKSITLVNFNKRYSNFSNQGKKSLNRSKITLMIKLFKSQMTEIYGDDFENLDNIKDLKALLTQHPQSLAIHYPRLSSRPRVNGKNYEWFEMNEKYIEKPLPLPSEDNGLPLTFVGEVKFFNNRKGYGFITIEDTEEDIFVHISNVEGQIPLNEGQRVIFEIAMGEKDFQAVDVRLN